MTLARPYVQSTVAERVNGMAFKTNEGVWEKVAGRNGIVYYRAVMYVCARREECCMHPAVLKKILTARLPALHLCVYGFFCLPVRSTHADAVVVIHPSSNRWMKRDGIVYFDFVGLH